MAEKSGSVVDAEKLSRIRAIIVEELELDIAPGDVDEDAHFVNDYDGDSLAIIQIVARVERELRIPLPKDRLAEVASLRGIEELAREAAGGAHSG